jgi:hypothetical protein
MSKIFYAYTGRELKDSIPGKRSRLQKETEERN